MEQRKRYVQKGMIHVQSCCFSNLSQDFLLGRRRRRCFISSPGVSKRSAWSKAIFHQSKSVLYQTDAYTEVWEINAASN